LIVDYFRRFEEFSNISHLSHTRETIEHKLVYTDSRLCSFSGFSHWRNYKKSTCIDNHRTYNWGRYLLIPL